MKKYILNLLLRGEFFINNVLKNKFNYVKYKYVLCIVLLMIIIILYNSSFLLIGLNIRKFKILWEIVEKRKYFFVKFFFILKGEF